jgi:hypothetical protein
MRERSRIHKRRINQVFSFFNESFADGPELSKPSQILQTSRSREAHDIFAEVSKVLAAFPFQH